MKTFLIDKTASKIVLGSTFERYAKPIAIPPITTTRILLFGKSYLSDIFLKFSDILSDIFKFFPEGNLKFF